METEVRCSLNICEYNKKGICIKKVITIKDNFPHHYSFRCVDYKVKT